MSPMFVPPSLPNDALIALRSAYLDELQGLAGVVPQNVGGSGTVSLSIPLPVGMSFHDLALCKQLGRRFGQHVQSFAAQKIIDSFTVVSESVKGPLEPRGETHKLAEILADAIDEVEGWGDRYLLLGPRTMVAPFVLSNPRGETPLHEFLTPWGAPLMVWTKAPKVDALYVVPVGGRGLSVYADKTLLEPGAEFVQEGIGWTLELTARLSVDFDGAPGVRIPLGGS